MKQYELGLYEKAMPETFSIAEKLAFAKELGFDYMEISIDETDKKQARIFQLELKEEIINAVKTAEFPIKTMCLSGHRKYPLGHKDPEVQKHSLEIMQAAIDFSLDVGIRIIQLAGYDVYYEESDEETRRNFEINLRKCVDMAAKAGVMMGFETMETDFMNSAAKAMKYFLCKNKQNACVL